MPSVTFTPASSVIPREVLKFEERVDRVTALERRLPRRLGWLANPFKGKLAQMRSASREAARRSHEAAQRRHNRVCREGGDNMVNGLAP